MGNVISNAGDGPGRRTKNAERAAEMARTLLEGDYQAYGIGGAYHLTRARQLADRDYEESLRSYRAVYDLLMGDTQVMEGRLRRVGTASTECPSLSRWPLSEESESSALYADLSVSDDRTPVETHSSRQGSAQNLGVNAESSLEALDEHPTKVSVCDTLGNQAHYDLMGDLCAEAGSVAMQHGDLDEAAQWFGLAHTCKPHSAEAAYQAGVTNQMLGLVGPAEDYLREALALSSSTHRGAYFNLGILLVEQSKYREALEAFEGLCEISPEGVNVEVLRMMAMCYENLDDIPAAISLLERLLMIDPNYHRAQQMLSRLTSLARPATGPPFGDICSSINA